MSDERNILRLLRPLTALALAALLSGCGTMADPTTWWGSEEGGPQPAELLDLENQLQPRELWSRDTGEGSAGQHLGLVPGVQGDRVYLADAGGAVIALTASDGKQLWEARLQDELTGGPGVGAGLVLLGNAEGQVIALDEADGKERWRARLSSEVLSAPVAGGGVVVARTGDGQVFGLDAADGKQLWRTGRNVPILTLRGNAAPVLSNGRVLVGLEGGRLLSLDLSTGRAVWETVVTVPSGRSELERVADLDGAPQVRNRTVYVAGYQGGVAALGEASGNRIWQKKLSSYNGLAVDLRRVYASDEEGTLWALDADTGAVVWSSKILSWRGLSAPVVLGDTVVVGDAEGYLHFFAAETGKPVARTRVGSDAIVAAPVVVGERLYVLGETGDFAVITLAKGR